MDTARNHQLLLPTTLLALVACAHHALAHLAPVAAVRVALVDSVPYATEEDSGYLRRVELRSGALVDTVPGVLTAELPIAVGARVLGFAYRDDEITGAFEYDAAHRRLKWDALPPDFNGYFSAPSIAPDGRHIAYIVEPGNDTAWTVIGTWPGGSPVWRSASVEVPATDFLGGNLTRWRSRDTAEVFIESGFSTGTEWFHVLVSVRPARLLRADTVRRPP